MNEATSGHTIYSSDFVERNFDHLRENAIQDFTRYACGWSVYSINFLNAVAELQGVNLRLRPEIVPELRRGSKRVGEPRLAKLMQEARDARSMKIEDIITLISAQAKRERRH
jgi:hypothetical protein